MVNLNISVKTKRKPGRKHTGKKAVVKNLETGEETEISAPTIKALSRKIRSIFNIDTNVKIPNSGTLKVSTI